MADLLERELDNLFPSGPPSLRSLAQSPAKFADAFASVDRRLQKAIGRAVFEFAMTGQWPKLLPEEKVLLFWRMRFGIAIAQSLAHARKVGGKKLLANPPTHKYSKEDLIQWLLEYAWNQAGHDYTRSLCLDFLRESSPPKKNLSAN